MSDRTVLRANDGEIITNGIVHGKEIYLSEGMSIDDFKTITQQEYDSICDYELLCTPEENAFWDELQNNGFRTNYSYAFSNWNHSKIMPKYSIKADQLMYMFLNCGEVTDMSHITITNTSELPNMMYACANCTKLLSPPKFIFNAPIVKTYTSMYSNCASMTNCEVYWGDGSKDPVYERNSCQNTFFNCKNLETIDFGNESTGSPIYLDLSWSTKLTIESIQSLLTSLQTIPEMSEGVYSIIISATTYNVLSDDILAGFTAKGWTLIGKERS